MIKYCKKKKVEREDIIKYLKPTQLIIEHQDATKIYGYKTKYFKVQTPYLSMKFIYCALLQTYTLAREECKKNKTEYDIIIRIRPDLYKFPYLTKEDHIKPIIRYIKTHDITGKLVGVLHIPGHSLSDNFYLLHYDDGEKFFNSMYYDYDRMCDTYTNRLMPEAIMKICTKELSLKRSVIPNIIGSITDILMFARKNNVITKSYNNLLRK